MVRPRIAKLAPIVLAAVAGLFAADEASAQCDVNNPLMVCPLSVCLALQADVNLICKTPAPLACRRLSGCNVLRRMKQHWLDCYVARTKINQICFSGGDWEHQEKAAEAITHVGDCEARMRLPEPIGCGDPCPF